MILFPGMDMEIIMEVMATVKATEPMETTTGKTIMVETCTQEMFIRDLEQHTDLGKFYLIFFICATIKPIFWKVI